MYYSYELGKLIPKKWKVQTIFKNELTRNIKSGVEKFDKKIYYATADIKGLEILEGKVIEYNNRESRANMQPEHFSVWFAKMKNSKKHLFITKNMNNFIQNAILSTGFFGLSCNEESFEYISSVIMDKNFEEQKDRFSHGATMESINNNDLNKIYLIIPDNNTIKLYHERIKYYFENLSKNIMENKKLEELRDFLLPLLMNGQVTIED